MILCSNWTNSFENGDKYDAVRYITSLIERNQYINYIKLLLIIIIYWNIDNLPFDESALSVITT